MCRNHIFQVTKNEKSWETKKKKKKNPQPHSPHHKKNNTTGLDKVFRMG